MANQKVTDLTAQLSVNTTDTYHVVNTTDTSQDPAGSSYKITWATLKTAILGYFSGGTGITYAGGVISSDPTATQTLTNKTLTSPAINNPAISSATLTGSTILTIGSDVSGDIHYRSSGGALARVALGSSGQFLGSNGSTPTWGTPGNPSGTIAMYGGSSAPANWLLCDGSAVSRSTYANLFTAISTTYGVGDGSTTFNIPNFKGKVPAGYDATQTEFNALAKTGGEKTHVLLTAEMPSHTHSVPIATVGGGSIAATGSGGTANQNTGSAGSDGAHNNLQPYLTVNYIIAI